MKSRLTLVVLIVALAAVAVAVNLRACSPPSDNLPREQVQRANRLHEIARRTGGDWNRLTPDEKQFLVNELAHGNEQSARMLLWGASRQGPPSQPSGAPAR